MIPLPANGLVYFDTNAVIYSVETHAKYWPLLEPVWAAAAAGRIRVLTGDLTLLEVLVQPYRTGDAEMADAYEAVLASPEVRMLPIDAGRLRAAARLRADVPGLKTPDALHAAASLGAGCGAFVTNDAGFRRVAGLPVVLLSELVAD